MLNHGVIKAAVATVGAVVALLGVEAVMVLNRDYVRDGTGRKIQGEFGEPSLPPLRLVVLGDSTSIGLGAKPMESYPWLLATRLGRRFRVQLNVVGVSGARTSDMARSQVPEAIRLEPDLALVAIGANDATHATSVSRVAKDMSAALDELLKAGIKVVVAGPPHMGTSRAFPQPLRALSGLNGKRVAGAIQEAAAARDIPFIDLSVTAPAFKNEPAKHYSEDMFHPGANGYEVWATAMFPTVMTAALEVTSTAAEGLKPR